MEHLIALLLHSFGELRAAGILQKILISTLSVCLPPGAQQTQCTSCMRLLVLLKPITGSDQVCARPIQQHYLIIRACHIGWMIFSEPGCGCRVAKTPFG